VKHLYSDDPAVSPLASKSYVAELVEAMASWVPETNPISLGELPLSGEEVEYKVSVAPAKQLLVYAFVTLHDETNSPFQRGYYEIYTKDLQGTPYKMFMNVVFGGAAGDTAMNSGNFWLPYGVGFQPGIFVRLVGVEMKTKKAQKSLAGKTFEAVMQEFCKQRDSDQEAIYSQIFVTGRQPA